MSTLYGPWIEGVLDRTDLTGVVPPNSGDLAGDPPDPLDEDRSTVSNFVAESGRGVTIDPLADSTP